MRYRAENNIGLIICDNTYISGWWYTSASEKNMSSSVGIMTFPIYGKINMVQTTNLICYI
jgi:hypothetical protein